MFITPFILQIYIFKVKILFVLCRSWGLRLTRVIAIKHFEKSREEVECFYTNLSTMCVYNSL